MLLFLGSPLSDYVFKIFRFRGKSDSNEFVEHFHKTFSKLQYDQTNRKKGLSKELSDTVVYCQAVKVPKPFTAQLIDEMEPLVPYHILLCLRNHRPLYEAGKIYNRLKKGRPP